VRLTRRQRALNRHAPATSGGLAEGARNVQDGPWGRLHGFQEGEDGPAQQRALLGRQNASFDAADEMEEVFSVGALIGHRVLLRRDSWDGAGHGLAAWLDGATAC
jgi:hypothetical protein